MGLYEVALYISDAADPKNLGGQSSKGMADSVKEEPLLRNSMDLFSGGFLKWGRKKLPGNKAAGKDGWKKEKHLQEAMLQLKNQVWKNAILKAADLQEGATTSTRNRHICA